MTFNHMGEKKVNIPYKRNENQNYVTFYPLSW